MATRKKEPLKNGQDGKSTWLGFVNLPLSQTETIDVIKDMIDDSDPERMLEEMLAHGYKVTLSYHVQNDAVICSVTGVTDKCPNKGYTSSTWAGSVFRAVAGMYYKLQFKTEWKSWSEYGNVGHLEL